MNSQPCLPIYIHCSWLCDGGWAVQIEAAHLSVCGCTFLI